MTAFQSKSFSVSEGPSEVPEAERQQNWADTFGNSCAICTKIGWAQTPMRNTPCPQAGCKMHFCADHRTKHMITIHNFFPTP